MNPHDDFDRFDTEKAPMSDLIEREAVLERLFTRCFAKHHSHSQTPCDDCKDAANAIRSLPAAVPVVDVARAAGELESRVLAQGEHWLGVGSYKDDARAILDAGVVGSVGVEDVRRAAHHILGYKETFELGKRLLAATEGR